MSETEPEKPQEEATVIVTFTKQWASYFVGETAAFSPEAAQRLLDIGAGEAAAVETLPETG